MAKLELERQPITGVISTFNNVVAVRKMTRTTTRRMATSTKSGKSGEYSLSLIHQFFLRESCTFVFFVRSRVQTLANVVHATGVKRGHFVVGTERDTDAHFFSCPAHVTDHQTHMRLAQGYVDCLSPHAHPKSLIRLMFRCTSLESHFSSPTPFSLFRSTLFPTQTPDSIIPPSLLNSSTSPKPCATPQGSLQFGRLVVQNPLTG